VPDAAAWIASFTVTARRLASAIERSLRLRLESLARAERRLQLLHPAQALAQRAQRLDELQVRALAAMQRLAVSRRERVLRQGALLTARSPAARVASLIDRTRHAGARLLPALRHRLAMAQAGADAAARGLNAVSPLATLERGYSIVTLAETGKVLTDAARAPPGTDVAVRLARGGLRARVTRNG
jgi:exodeoxyribonuclease VII large subunit